MPQFGVPKSVFFNQTGNPVGVAGVGDIWWDGTTLRIMIGGPALGPLVWRDVTTVAGTA